MSYLLDMHHVGQRQTGNETWVRHVGAQLVPMLAPDVALALSKGVASTFMPGVEREVVSSSSLRRLALDLPRIARRRGVGALLAQYTAPLTRIPSIVAIHDLSFEDPRAREWLSTRTILRYRATIRVSAKRAAHVIALSESTRRDLVAYFGLDESSVSVAHAAVDFDQFHAATGAERTPGRVLVVGNLVPRKNIPIVAEALSQLRAKHPHAHLRVVGTVPPSGALIAERMRGLLGEENVSFSGHVSSEQLVAEYAQASVFAYPSLYEGFGLPILEALAAGLPVMCSDSSSLPEVIGNAGTILSQTNVNEWIDALDHALSHPDVDPTTLERGYARCHEFSWTRTAEIIARRLMEAHA